MSESAATTLVRGGLVLTMAGDEGVRPIEADVLIVGDRIERVGRDLEAPGAKVVDARDHLVVPGLVNSHYHSNQNLLRGRYRGRPLELAMLYAFPFDGAYEPSSRLVHLRTLLGAAESLKRGVTCVLDDVAELPLQTLDQLGVVFGAYEEIGMRANCSGHVMNRPYIETLPYAEEMFSAELKAEFGAVAPPTTEAYLEFCSEAIRRHHDPSGRLRYVVAPSGPQRCTDDLLEAAIDFADAEDTAFHIHVAETKMQAVVGRQLYGESLVGHLRTIGALRPRMTLAHTIWINNEDIAALADSGCSVAHNPVCNMKIGSGVAPLRSLLSAGVNVGVGTDQLNMNDSASLFRVMHTAGIIHNPGTVDYDEWPSPEEILRAATLGGARSICLEDEIGTLEPGKRADMVLLDLDSLPFVPLNDPLAHLVYAEDGSSVDHVLVNGEVVVEGGRLTRIDEAAVRAEVRELAGDYLAAQERWELRAQKFEPEFKALYMRCMAEPDQHQTLDA